CSCSAGRRSGCRHLKQLEGQIREFHRALGGSWFDLFTRSGWFRLAQTVFEDNLPSASDCSVLQERPGGPIRLFTPGGVEVLRYVEQSPAVVRFLERIGKLSSGTSVADRSGLLERLSTFMRTPEEQHLNKAGMQTNRQFFERSLWCRVAYHALREYGDIPGGAPGGGELAAARIRLEPSVDLRGGSVFLKVRADSDASVRFQIAVPRKRVGDAFALLAETGQCSVTPLPAADLFYVGPDTRIDEKRKLDILRLAAEGEEILDEPGRKRFSYGDLVYVEELGILVRRSERSEGRWREPRFLDLEAAAIDTFRSEASALEPSPTLAENPLAGLGILTEFDYIEIAPEGED
ncbi:MAG: hypothetical protein OXF79_10825, partial [Chloroflexi bacterium]|nr:hypothetical protein [Chloroflexota bacterium]